MLMGCIIRECILRHEKQCRSFNADIDMYRASCVYVALKKQIIAENTVNLNISQDTHIRS